MRIDPRLDAQIFKEGKCRGCGETRVVVSSWGGYCAKCRGSVMVETAYVDTAEAARRELARRELARRRFLPFILRVKPDYKAGWFHRDLAARLERFVRRVERGESPKMIISAPPRHGKSEQTSRCLPAWALGRNPEWSIISATHSDRLATDNSRDVLAIMNDPLYQTVFPEVALDKNAKGAMGWRTNRGGRYKPLGVGAGISGYGANILIIDDPHRDKDAYSETVRASIWRWYKSSARTRLMPGGGQLIIQTRWVLDDLTGMVLDEEGTVDEGGEWELVCYPAEAVEDEYRLPDGRVVHEEQEGAVLLRRKGEALDPERYPLESLEQHKADPVTWAALYQQNPVAEGAGTVSEELLAQCECLLSDVPKQLVHYTTWDTAVSQNDASCNSAAATGGVDKDGVLWIVDARQGRWDSLELAEIMIGMFRRYRQERVGVEKTNHSVAVKPFLERYIEENREYGLVVEDLEHGNKDKVMRARPMQAMMRAGKVRIPKDASWYPMLREELLRFPAKPNDLADAFFYLGQLLATMDRPHEARPRAKRSWRDKVRRRSRKSWRLA